MRKRQPKIAIVECDWSLAITYRAYLRRDKARVELLGEARSVLSMLALEPPDLILLDAELPDSGCLEILRYIKRKELPTRVVVMTTSNCSSAVADTCREAAFDLLVKPFSADRFRAAVNKAVQEKARSRLPSQMDEPMSQEPFCGFIGRSKAMQAVYRTIESAAVSKATVFVTGESGTGKEVCAAALHTLSKRSKGPFVAVNCAAIPRDLLESELFGHVRGSFTGATSDRHGAVLQANGGTLFLDEIGEMDIAFQAKMLRFLETGAVQRIGEDLPRPSDIRIVCATNRDPRAEIDAGRFREDLFYRLHVIPVEMPPLREREEDVVLLARAFLDDMAQEDGKTFEGFAPDAELALLAHCWPGNVRELKNVVRKIVVLHPGGLIALGDLPIDVREGGRFVGRQSDRGRTAAGLAAGPMPVKPLDEHIDDAIDAAITHCNGSIPKAAGLLKVSPSTIYRRLNGRPGPRAI